jgi:hypothetical protein
LENIFKSDSRRTLTIVYPLPSRRLSSWLPLPNRSLFNFLLLYNHWLFKQKNNLTAILLLPILRSKIGAFCKRLENIYQIE